MFKKILGAFKWIGGLFKKGPKPIVANPSKVVSVTVEIIDGKKYKVTKYGDGRTKKEPYNASDPSGISDFLDNLNK